MTAIEKIQLCRARGFITFQSRSRPAEARQGCVGPNRKREPERLADEKTRELTRASVPREEAMLALLGLVTIVLLLVVIMTKRMSPLIALIVIPIAAALVGGFGLDTGKFVLSGIQSLAAVVGMFVFAILFFGVVSDAGMLDPIIDRILATVGTRPTRIVM